MSLSVFKMPKPVSIAGRSSTITNSFVNSIIPIVVPSDHEVAEALEVLGMDAATICCAYCGDIYTEWDHFRPIVKDKGPTGYISEIQNLVPACGKCNQSKGNKQWDVWIFGDAKLSPKSRHILNIDIKVKNLKAYEAWRSPTKLDFATVVGADLWNRHQDNWDNVLNTMKEAQMLVAELKNKIEQHLEGRP